MVKRSIEKKVNMGLVLSRIVLTKNGKGDDSSTILPIAVVSLFFCRKGMWGERRSSRLQ